MAFNQVNVLGLVRHRYLPEADYIAFNPVLLKGELAFVSDLPDATFKVGDGVTDWAGLPYFQAGVSSVNGQTGVVVVTAADVGLGNVDNTSDLNKPISTATQSALNGKANTIHTHVANQITNFDNAADLRVTAGINAHVAELDPHTQYLLQTTAAATYATLASLTLKADLVGGVVPTSQIPAVAITEFLGEVASEPAMLALSGQRGDWCIRTDVNLTYFLIADDPTVITSWRFLQTPGSPVSSVNGQTGAVVLGKGDVGLGNVDNTSDLGKPISTATQNALNGKEATITPGTTAQYYRGDKTFQTLDKTAVGLGNVDNTSDADKPVSTATQAALNSKPDIGIDAYATVNASGSALKSFGFSSINRAGAGTYTFVFSTPAADANYAVVGSSRQNTNIDDTTVVSSNHSTTQFQIRITTSDNGGTADVLTDLPFSIIVAGK